VDDPELFELAKAAIGHEHELTPQQAARLRGQTAAELRDDAKLMRVELGLDSPDDDRPRDRGGRFARSGGVFDMNRELRRAAGRG
jgi:hypothetical protein